MGQNIKSVCVCLSVCEHSHSRISWYIFTKLGTDVRTSLLEVNIAPPISSILPPISGQKVLKTHANIKYSYICRKCTRIAEISASWRKLGSRDTMVTSAFRPKVEIWWPFRACAMHPAIIIGTVCSLWTWLWGRHPVSQNVFVVVFENLFL